MSQRVMGRGPWCGTIGGYTNHHCRCERCSTAWAAYILRRQRERSATYDGSKCGRYTTYFNYRCRCDACRGAWAAYQRRRRAATRRDPS